MPDHTDRGAALRPLPPDVMTPGLVVHHDVGAEEVHQRRVQGDQHDGGMAIR